MKNKLILALILILTLTLSVFGLAACGGAAEVQDERMISVYNLYAATAEENGTTPLTYEEWLASIKGEKGKDGVNGKDGKAGVGISSAVINGEGNLIITLTDNTVINAGTVVVPAFKIDENNKISFSTFTVTDKSVSGKVPNQTEAFYFTEEIEIKGGAGYKVYKDFDCEQEIISKTVKLDIGDNYFYLLEYCGEYSNFYTVNVRRKPVYTVTFDANGGSECAAQRVEEDSFAVDPEPVKNGYDYTWDYDFATPVTEDITVTAAWQAIFTVSGNSVTGLTAYGKTLTEIIIPQTIDGAEINGIGVEAFKNYSRLTSVTINSGVTSIGDRAFYLCKGLNTVYYTGDVADWCGISMGMEHCLTEYTKNLYINDRLVEGDLVIPSGVTAIPNYAFKNCKRLTSVILPDTVSRIGYEAFKNCSSLTSVTIPNAGISMWFNTFDNCSSVTSVYYGGTQEQWKNNYSGGVYVGAKRTYVISESCVVYCTDGEIGING